MKLENEIEEEAITAEEEYPSERLSEEEIYLNILSALEQGDEEAFRAEFFQNHTYDQAQVYLRLPKIERETANHFLTTNELAEMFDIIDDEDGEIFLEYLLALPEEKAAGVLGDMYTDNAADILKEVDRPRRRAYLRLMPKKRADAIKQLMNYADETAGGVMTTEFLSIKAQQTARSAMTLLRAKADSAESIYYIYVVNDDKRLVGVLSLRDLILADANAIVSDLMSQRVISVDVNEDQLDVARTIKDYDLLAVPVTEVTGELLGIVTVDDIIDIIDEEAASDYSGLAGVDVVTKHTSPAQAARSRLPWLITLLCLGIGTSTLISQFEDMIAEVATLSLFITLITGTAGNAGTQSLAVAVRKLANSNDDEDSLLKMILREIFTGLLCGLVTGLTIMTIVFLWQRNLTLGMVVGVAMLCAITVANLAGSLIPILMDRLGFDPAVASGPFITTLSDLTSVLIYFTIASQFLTYLS